MSSVKHFIDESIRKTGVDEFLWKEFERAGYGGVDITKTLEAEVEPGEEEAEE